MYLQAYPSTGGGLTLSGLLFIIIIIVLVCYKFLPKGKMGWQIWALTYNISHYGHGSFEVESSIKKIVSKMLKNDEIQVKHLDFTHEIGSRYKGILYSDKGTYNISIIADKSGSVNYTINERIAD